MLQDLGSRIPRTSKLELQLEWQLKVAGILDDFTREHRFHVERRWRFDFADLRRRIAVEVEGQSRGKSRHMTFEGYRRDCEKYNQAAIAGWCVLRFTKDEIATGAALRTIEQAREVLDDRLEGSDQ